MGTALITGATSGIGLELAWQLAAAQHDLVLVARTASRLEQVAEELRQLAGIQVQVIAADLSEPIGIEAVAQRLRVARPAGPRPAEVAQRPVDLLVNNAGFAVGQRFVGGDIEQERRAMAVMVRAVMELTHAALPGMVERGHGAILSISSATALTAMGTYAAHKAWVHARAHMDEGAWPAFAWLNAEDVARQALAAVRRGQVICTPSVRYLAVNAALRMSPRWLVRRVAGHASVRNQY